VHRAPRAFAEHALVTGSYNAGAYFPVGGPARFAQTLLPVIDAAGGGLRLGAEVREIVLDAHGAVAGVRWAEAGAGATAGAPLHEEPTRRVVSAMGAHNTAQALPAGVAGPWRQELSTFEAGVGFVALYIGLEGDIAALGASSANHWIYASEDIGRLWRQPADEDAPGLFVSFPSLKDPAWAGPPTAEVLAPVDSAAFGPWLAGEATAPDYAAFKDWIAARLLGQFQRAFPALADKVRFHEAATPLTQKRYVRTPAGAMYGLEMTGERLLSAALHLKTPVPGLLLAGQDVMGPGVQAAFMGGLLAAATLEPRLWRELGR
jgi:all-trans-retinol 13,14-reductase